MNLRSFSLQKIPIANRFMGPFRLSLIVLAVTCLTVSAVHAQSESEPTLLSLEKAVQLTLEQHPQLGTFFHQREAYQGLVEQV